METKSFEILYACLIVFVQLSLSLYVSRRLSLSTAIYIVVEDGFNLYKNSCLSSWNETESNLFSNFCRHDREAKIKFILFSFRRIQ